MWTRKRLGRPFVQRERLRTICAIHRSKVVWEIRKGSRLWRTAVQIQTQGLIIREQTIGESDRLVTILTRDQGVLRAFARRAKSMKDSKHSATQLLCYSRLNIYEGRDKYIINDAFPIEVFFDLRKDIGSLSLAQYFCELAMEVAPEGVESQDFLRLVLNGLHFLCKGEKPPALIKAVVELRMLALAGFMPNLICCGECGAYEADEMYFKVSRGLIFCKDCYENRGDPTVKLSRAALTGMRFIIYSDFEKIFSFTLSDGALKELSQAVESYTVHVLQKRLKTLDFYTSLL